MTNQLPLTKTEDQKKFWEKLQPVNRVATTDTYKRTMAGSSDIFALNYSCYTLAARRPLKEKLVDQLENEEDSRCNNLIVTGIEKMLYPWFMNPVSDTEIETAEKFFTEKAQVDKFPKNAWELVKANDGYFPIDIYGMPGGQTILVKDGKHVPIMSVEGPGALVSHLEPHLENMFAPIIQATKARLFRDVAGTQFAEFGLRSDQNENNHITLMQAVYVGGGIKLTSDDQAVMLFPEYFEDIGTMGHEYVMSYQRQGLSLEEAQERAFDDFVKANKRSALLVDTVDTIGSGLPAVIRMIKKYSGTGKIILPRFDSGDVSKQCIIWKKMTLDHGIKETKMIVEDGYNPIKAMRTKNSYSTAGFNPEDIIVGAGGYFQEGCNRDSLSLVFKRSATDHIGDRKNLEASLKFSDDSGKNSIPGRIRVYERKNILIVAQEGEEIHDATPLYVKLVENGRIIYNEDLEIQRQRAERTWKLYDTIEYSSKTLEIIESRYKEKKDIEMRYGGKY